MGKKDTKGNPLRKERFTKFSKAFADCDAWRALSCPAQAIYPFLRMELRGENPEISGNGKVTLSCRQAGNVVGIHKDTAAKALLDLQAKGFIVVTKPAVLGVDGVAKSPEYELTELPMLGKPRASQLFLRWKEGKDYPVVRSPARNPKGKGGAQPFGKAGDFRLIEGGRT